MRFNLGLLLISYIETPLVSGSARKHAWTEGGEPVAKRQVSEDLGGFMRRLTFGNETAEPPEPESVDIPSLLRVSSSAAPVPVASDRMSTPPRRRVVPIPPGSPPDGTLVNVGGSSTPSSPARGGSASAAASDRPTTPPRSARPLASSALQDTPDRPSLYGKYEASSDLIPLSEDVPEYLPLTRVGYSYSDKAMTGLDKQTRQLALLQVSDDIDNMKSSPQLGYRLEYIEGGIPSPIHRVDQVITNRIETVIMTVQGMPDKVIKYQTNCQALYGGNEVHPILREYWISRFVDEESARWLREHGGSDLSYQVSPRVFFVSPPAALDMTRTMKTDFAMDPTMRRNCVRRGATVRYMIMERTGSNTEDFMSLYDESTNRVDFKLGMRILHQVILRLRILHSIGVVHGDIHMGNIVRALGGDRGQFLLIDYGLAFFKPLGTQVSENRAFTDQFRGSSITTHWEMMGYTKSYRDDILRAMMTVGRIMNGPEYISLLQETEGHTGGLESLANYFAHGDLFVTPVAGGYDPLQEVANITEPVRDAVRTKLADIRQYAQGIASVNTAPNYDYMIGNIEDILTLLN